MDTPILVEQAGFEPTRARLHGPHFLIMLLLRMARPGRTLQYLDLSLPR